MDKINMEYNSQTDNLRIPEYGRHIQNLIKYISKIEDKEKRQAFTDYIVNLMYFINREDNNSSDKKDKLWKHAVLISGHELDVSLPDGSPITKEDTKIEPRKLDYPVSQARFRHYGHYVQELIKKALEVEDEEERRQFVQVIASYMKLAYLTWNKSHYVNDDAIKQDLKVLSKGQLVLDDKDSLDYLSHSSKNQRSNNNNNNNNNNHKKGKRRRRRSSRSNRNSRK